MLKSIDRQILSHFNAKEFKIVTELALEHWGEIDKKSRILCIRSFYQLGDFTNSLEFSRQASDAHKGEYIFDLFVARSLMKLEKKDSSLGVYNKISIAHPDVAEPFIVLSREKYAMGDYDGAIKEIRKFPGDIETDLQMQIIIARSLQALGRPKESLSVWKNITILDQSNLLAHYKIGQIHYYDKNFEQSITWLEKSIQLNPEHKNSRRLIGLCYDAIGEYKLAIKWLMEEAISDPLLYSNWAKVIDSMLKDGGYQESRKLIQSIPNYIEEEHHSNWIQFLLAKKVQWSEFSDSLWDSITKKTKFDSKKTEAVAKDLINLGEIGRALKLIDSANENGTDTSSVTAIIEGVTSDLGLNPEYVRKNGDILAVEMAIESIARDCSRIRFTKPSSWPTSVMHVSSSMGQGGAERQLLTLATAQVKDPRFSEVMLLTYANQDPDHTYINEAEAAGIKLLFYSGQRFTRKEINKSPKMIPDRLTKFLPIRFDRDLGPITRAIDIHRPGIVHTWQDETNIIGGLSAMWIGHPAVVMSCRSMRPDAKTMPHIRNRPYLLRAYKTLLKDQRFRLVSNSDAGRLSYEQWIGPELTGTKVVRNGYDFAAFNPSNPKLVSHFLQENAVPKDALIVGGIFRFVPQKRIDLWIEVARRVLRRSDKTFFVAVGHGPGLNEAKSTVKKLKLGNRILFPGRTKDVPSWLDVFDIFLLTSNVEGLPNVLIEAQSRGIPVISTVAGGASETFVDGLTGYLSSSDDPSNLANSVTLVLQDETWRDHVRSRSITLIEENFGVDKMANAYHKIYSNLLRDSSVCWGENRTFMDKLLFRR